MSQKIAKPLSRSDIRRFALSLRRKLGLENEINFPIVEVIERLHLIYSDFQFEVCEIEEMKNVHGLTSAVDQVMRIREDVYEGATEGKGRDRLTLAHELFHYLWHRDVNLNFARMDRNYTPKTYEDPEWQADAFAGELLVPYHLSKDLSITEISDFCGVSYDAAACQFKAFKR